MSHVSEVEGKGSRKNSIVGDIFKAFSKGKNKQNSASLKTVKCFYINMSWFVGLQGKPNEQEAVLSYLPKFFEEFISLQTKRYYCNKMILSAFSQNTEN